MKTEEQRIAIAKACGWKFPQDSMANGPFVISPTGVEKWHGDDPMTVRWALQTKVVPDYPNDLNAIHEAEMLNIRSLSAVERYRVALREVLAEKFAVESDITACAAHRSEALIRTLNLSKDNQ